MNGRCDLSKWKMVAIADCGDIQSGKEYTILERGLDWYLTKINGKCRYVYSWVFDANPLKIILEQIHVRQQVS